MELENHIECSIFLDTEAVIKKTLVKINKAQSVKEKQYYIQDILLEAKALSPCPHYKPANLDCLYCSFALRGYVRKCGHINSSKTGIR